MVSKFPNVDSSEDESPFDCRRTLVCHRSRSVSVVRFSEVRSSVLVLQGKKQEEVVPNHRALVAWKADLHVGGKFSIEVPIFPQENKCENLYRVCLPDMVGRR